MACLLASVALQDCSFASCLFAICFELLLQGTGASQEVSNVQMTFIGEMPLVKDVPAADMPSADHYR